MKFEHQENSYIMESKTDKKFDAVRMMRNIRNKIDREFESMSPKQRHAYYKKQKEEFEEWKMARNQQTLK